jgi:hypothetical protein
MITDLVQLTTYHFDSFSPFLLSLLGLMPFHQVSNNFNNRKHNIYAKSQKPPPYSKLIFSQSATFPQ